MGEGCELVVVTPSKRIHPYNQAHGLHDLERWIVVLDASTDHEKQCPGPRIDGLNRIPVLDKTPVFEAKNVHDDEPFGLVSPVLRLERGMAMEHDPVAAGDRIFHVESVVGIALHNALHVANQAGYLRWDRSIVLGIVTVIVVGEDVIEVVFVDKLLKKIAHNADVVRLDVAPGVVLQLVEFDLKGVHDGSVVGRISCSKCFEGKPIRVRAAIARLEFDSFFVQGLVRYLQDVSVGSVESEVGCC